MVPRWSLIVLAFACKERTKEVPPPPPPPPVAVDAAPDAAPDAAIDTAADAASAGDAGIDALDPVMAEVMGSPPCCCALATEEPEHETQPRLFCQQDLHGTCVAASKCPRPGSVEAQIATWWKAVAAGEPAKHAAPGFVIEAFVPPDEHYGQTCARPYVTDVPSANDACLRLAVFHSRPPRWRAGWGCKGFSGTDLANNLKAQRTAAKDRLRCGNRSDRGVFVAVDAAGKVTAFLVNSR